MNSQTSTIYTPKDIIHSINILGVNSIDSTLLETLLIDQTTGKNILWATTDYERLGPEFEIFCQIKPELITGKYAALIQSRITKTNKKKTNRTKHKAEVFTPAWICNKQNNIVDSDWFGRKNVFNIEHNKTWVAVPEPVSFEGCSFDWKDYVNAQRLEITCGEAPYLVSRYDLITGEWIELDQRIGLLDRKMRLIKENTETEEEWLFWAQKAFESIYGYEYQGDSLLVARENLLLSYIEYFFDRFHYMPENYLLMEIAEIISWNIWQMDGLKFIVPGSDLKERSTDQDLNLFNYQIFDDEYRELKSYQINHSFSCKKRPVSNQEGIYCKLKDWQTGEIMTYISLTQENVNE